MLPDTNSLADAESLLETARGQLERRLRAGEPCRAEELFRQYPALLHHPELAVQLVFTEFALCEELGRQTPLDDWFRRFPQWSDELHRRLENYADLRPQDIDSGPTIPYTAPEDHDTATRNERGPAHLGRYHLLNQIGGGGMGVVHRARGPAPLDRIVALKQLRAGKTALPEEVQRFALEARVAGGLRHPHILPIYDQGEHDGLLFFTMPLIEGGNLTRHLDRLRADPRAAAGLVEKIASAVQFLHENGVLHRDLKPSNILLDVGDEPLVTDFGLVKLLDGDAALTETGRVMGTPAYLSPEQAAGRTRQVAETSDVWALGVILYELLTGQRPFQSDDRDELYRRILADEPAAPRRLAPALDARLENIVLKCLAKEPGERYQTAAALADDLRSWLEGRQPQARPPRRWARAFKAVRRRPWVSGAVVVLFFLAVGFGAAFLLGKPADPRADALKKLKDGDPVTWIAEMGPPLAYTSGYGAGDAVIQKDRRQPFGIMTNALTQLDLVPDPQRDHYRLRVQVQHADVLDANSEFGVTFDHQTVSTGDGVHHFLLVLLLNERIEDIPAGASFTLIHFLDNGRDPPALHRANLGVGTTLPDPPPNAGRPWRRIDAVVTPDKISVTLDDVALRDLTWAFVAKKATLLMNQKNIGPHVEPPVLGPRGTLGLYALRTAAAFRSFVIEP